MKEYFYSLVDKAKTYLQNSERLLVSLQGESSHFCRFNHAKIRQIGKVDHLRLEIRLENHSRHAALDLTLSTNLEIDQFRLKAAIENLRAVIGTLEADPYFMMNENVASSEYQKSSNLPEVSHSIDEIILASQGLDMVGFLANGKVYRGFANSLGQKNWFESDSFNFDWSVYLKEDKAVKSQYAGFDWNGSELREKMSEARHQLSILDRPVKDLKPGKYRVFLAPAAVCEVMNLLSWRGFGLKNQRTKSSPLVKLVDKSSSLSHMLSISEDVEGGVSPNFDSFGFLKPKSVSLVSDGRFSGSLVSPRSSREFEVPTTGASDWESPESMNMNPGNLKKVDILSKLDSGLYINNLWYMNFSDAPSCRMTGMTRFASFWVENGEIKCPLSVMRFDDSFYRMFGENLIDLTQEQEMILSSSTYDGRSTHSSRLPGAMLRELQLTL